MNVPIKVSVAIGLIIVAFASFAGDEEHIRTNLAADYAQCWSYFTITAEGVRRGGSPEAAEWYAGYAELAFLRGTALSNVEVTTARAEVARSQQLEEMRNNFSNLEILYVKYHEMCTTLLEDPADRIEYWRQQG